MPKQKYSYVGTYRDSGSQNSFYKVKGKKYGFKGFPNKSLATFAHVVQDTLSKEYLAPYVYSPVCRIRIPNYFVESDGNGGMKTVTDMVLSDWGYLTEIAKPYSCKDYECDGDCAYNSCCVSNNAIDELIDNIKGCGLDYIDAHAFNLGYVKRGDQDVLVVIDCGAESVDAVDDFYPDVCWDGAEDMECCCEQCRGKYSDA